MLGLMDRSTLGAQILQLRQARGLTLREAAQRCGVHYSTLGQVEKGQINITLDTLDRIAVGLGGVARVAVHDAQEAEEEPFPPAHRRGVAQRMLAILAKLPEDELDVLLVQMALWERRYGR